ncbi:hypothetical protein ACQKMV_13715 [Lysinibacillus sp. NPDC094403]|uniref:hypothetical protein n=1 Tax=Lysinibacillus sp. NPDC094403 TaxID=3390581 RepID=UPI003D081774
MDILLSVLIVIAYVGLMYYIFGLLTKLMKQKSSDFMVQILPGWILIMVSSSGVLLLAPHYLTYQIIFKLIMFTSVGICLISLFLLIVVKRLSLSKYNALILKLKENREIK